MLRFGKTVCTWFLTFCGIVLVFLLRYAYLTKQPHHIMLQSLRRKKVNGMELIITWTANKDNKEFGRVSPI